MRRVLFGILPLALLLGALGADDPPKQKTKQDKKTTPAEQFRAIKAEFDKELKAAQKAFGEAADATERKKIRDEFQKKVSAVADQMVTFAEKNAKDSTAMDALNIV